MTGQHPSEPPVDYPEGTAQVLVSATLLRMWADELGVTFTQWGPPEEWNGLVYTPTMVLRRGAETQRDRLRSALADKRLAHRSIDVRVPGESTVTLNADAFDNLLEAARAALSDPTPEKP